jgi:hypothetical protein
VFGAMPGLRSCIFEKIYKIDQLHNMFQINHLDNKYKFEEIYMNITKPT